MPQIRAEQLEPALALGPDLASVLAGVNDILRPHVDLDVIAGDMEAIVAALREGGATVIMMTYPDPTAVISAAAARIRARVGTFNGRLRAIASRNDAVLVDLDRDGIAHPSLWCEDRPHANDLGHERMARHRAGHLEPLSSGAGPPGVAPSVGPELLDDLRLALMAGSEGEHLEPVRSGLEGANHLGRDPDRVELGDLDDLVVELDPPGSGEHHVDLLGQLVTMGEGLA